MTLDAIINHLLIDTVQISLPLFRPELVLCATIVTLLLAKIVPLFDRIDPFLIALVGATVALLSAFPEGGLAVPRTELFTGMLVYDSLTVSLRVILLAFAVLFVLLSKLTGLADRQDGQDFFTLVLGATLGMCLMSSVNHLMMVFLAVEMASVPSYVLAGIVKGRQRAGEAALKYSIYGAGTAGIMLYGLSLLIGVLGTAHIPTIAVRLAELNLPSMLAGEGDPGKLMVLALGALMVMVGIAFKLSAVPFHFWCPDVFEGATAEVDAFLSVASKAAALALLVRVAVGVSMPVENSNVTQSRPVVQYASAVSADGDVGTPVIGVAADIHAKDADPLGPVRTFIATLLAVIAAVTCTFGNLAAYGQTNIKRMLAYSTIAHAGFLIMPVAAAVLVVGNPNKLVASEAITALLLYLAIYLFMNLGAFAIVAFLRNAMQSEAIDDYAGLIRTAPVTAVALTLILVSLIGLPPLAGFWPKLGVFMALYQAGGAVMITVLVVAALNTVISLIYYLRVAKRMCIDPEPDTRGPVELGIFPSVYVFAITVPIVLCGIYPAWLINLTQIAGENLFR